MQRNNSSVQLTEQVREGGREGERERGGQIDTWGVSAVNSLG
jgi:hypothetical protein